MSLMYCRCGLAMVENPSPQAGELKHLLKVGSVYECIPCLVKSRHYWSQRALEAEGQLFELKAEMEFKEEVKA